MGPARLQGQQEPSARGCAFPPKAAPLTPGLASGPTWGRGSAGRDPASLLGAALRPPCPRGQLAPQGSPEEGRGGPCGGAQAPQEASAHGGASAGRHLRPPRPGASPGSCPPPPPPSPPRPNGWTQGRVFSFAFSRIFHLLKHSPLLLEAWPPALRGCCQRASPAGSRAPGSCGGVRPGGAPADGDRPLCHGARRTGCDGGHVPLRAPCPCPPPSPLPSWTRQEGSRGRTSSRQGSRELWPRVRVGPGRVRRGGEEHAARRGSRPLHVGGPAHVGFPTTPRNSQLRQDGRRGPGCLRSGRYSPGRAAAPG